jgi:signal transduction histidine kinase
VSLRLRLLLAVGAISVIALVVADFATYSALRTNLYQQVDKSLAPYHPRVYLDAVTGQVVAPCQSPQGSGSGGPGGFPVDSGGPGGGSNAFDSTFFEIRTSGGQLVDGLTCPAYVGSHAYRPELPSSISGFSRQPDGSQARYFTASSTTAGGPAFRVHASQIASDDPNFGNDQLIVAIPIGNTTNTLHSLFLIELAVTAAALVFALFGGWWLVRLGLRPLAEVERTADSIAAGNLDQRVPGADDTTEVGRLARALNVMLERIESAFSARLASEARLKESDRHLRQFVADASHELRTPIAAVSAYAELFERGAASRDADLPRVVSGIRSETARMERLVNDLLTLARLDEGVPIQIVATELVGLCAEAVRTAATVGPQWPLQFTASQPVEVMGDPVRLRQVIDNLLANVRAHTPEGTATTVTVAQVGDGAEIVVRDTGPGMPSEDAARAFERFYRVDQARTRAHGGAGLGLSIVHAIVTAHGGTVWAESSPGGGMAITVRLPLVPEEPEQAPPPLTPLTAHEPSAPDDVSAPAAPA